MSGALRYEVLISDPIAQAIVALTPSGHPRVWSPMSHAVIVGDTEAVLVDPPLTSVQADSVAEQLARLDREVTFIYLTHGHGDHWFTADRLAQRFGAQVVATEGTIAQMHRNLDLRPVLWDVAFPSQIPETSVTARSVSEVDLTVDGHPLSVVEVGHSDTDDSTVLHVPDLGLVVAGDVIYNDVHQYLAESAGSGRDRWRDAVGVVEALDPTYIVAGHKNKVLDDDARRQIAGTRAYLDDADAVFEGASSAEEFYWGMLSRYPKRLNPGALWNGAQALFR